MEGLGWWIYLCSATGRILAISLTIFMVCLAALLITSATYCSDECELKTAKKWWKYTGIIGAISMIFVILIPSRSTCYKFLELQLQQNSEALQELPEKSFEAINRLLDSIASEDKEKEN